MTDEGLCRVGWSTQNATLELGMCGWGVYGCEGVREMLVTFLVVIPDVPLLCQARTSLGLVLEAQGRSRSAASLTAMER